MTTKTVFHRISAITCAGLLALTLMVLSGCASAPSPAPYRLSEDGLPVSFKRVERYPNRDFVHHILRTAYRKPPIAERMTWQSQDKANLVEQLGRPQWIRKPFVSLQGETVEEWLYMDQARIFQFIGHQIVFEGPLTDHELLLLQRGYPDRSILSESNYQRINQIYIYNDFFGQSLDEFNFSDGMLVQGKEGQ